MPEGITINERYELQPLPLARGGMGEVWIGRDVKLEREVAVKFVRFPQDEPDQELVRRFVRESRITARLEHPGVPAVYDAGTHDGRPYLVMQRIHGIGLNDLIAEEGPLPVGWAAAIAAQTCAVLSAAHRASLVHRDLKPSNLMLELDGCVKVLDFGLAVALDHADVSRITNTGQTLGTPAYMAPEQILTGMSGPHSDLYGLGCTLHEMLSGRPVFSASTAYAVMSQQVDARPLALRRLRPDVPAGLERLVLALLEKNPEDRPPDADAVYDGLLPFMTDLTALPTVVRPASAPSPRHRYARVLARVIAPTAAVGAGGGSLAVAGEGPGNPAGSAGSADAAGVVGSGEAGEAGEAGEPGEPGGAGAVPAAMGMSWFSRSELDRARAEASRLVQQSRHSQAAELLAAVLAPATQAWGSTDDDVASLRMELANVLFEGGDYRRAAPAYQQLAVDLARRHTPDAEPVLRCRMQEATCHALAGQTTLALRQLDQLLHDERRVFGDDHPHVLDLRRQIGLLQLGVGQRTAAEETLRELLSDLTRRYGPTHPNAAAIATVLDRLS